MFKPAPDITNRAPSELSTMREYMEGSSMLGDDGELGVGGLGACEPSRFGM